MAPAFNLCRLLTRRLQAAFGQGLPPLVSSWETHRWRKLVAEHVSARAESVAAAAAAAASVLPLFSARLASSSAAGGAYLLGALPSSADAALLAQLAYILHAPPLASSPLRERLLAREQQGLLAYVNARLGGPHALFGSSPPGQSGPARPGAPSPPRLPAAERAAAPAAGVSSAAGGFGLSERRKSQLAVAFALSSCLAYVAGNELVEFQFYDDEPEEDDVDVQAEDSAPDDE